LKDGPASAPYPLTCPSPYTITLRDTPLIFWNQALFSINVSSRSNVYNRYDFLLVEEAEREDGSDSVTLNSFQGLMRDAETSSA